MRDLFCFSFVFLLVGTFFSPLVVEAQTGLIELPNYIPTNISEVPAQLADNWLFPYFGSSTDFSWSLVNSEIFLRGWLMYPVYLDATNLSGPEEAMENTQDLINQIGLGLLALTPRTCGQNLLKFAVGGRLPIGYIVDFDFSTVGVPIDPVFFPALPSYEICTNFRDSCTGFIPQENLDAILGEGGCERTFNASVLGGLVVFPEQPQFPENASTIIMLGQFVTHIPAWNFETEDFEYTPYCQNPLSFNEKAFTVNSTARPCQDHCLSYLLYTRGQWNSAKIVLGTLGWFVLITCSILTLTFLFSEKYRKYPGIMTTLLTLTFCMIVVPFCIGAVTGLEEVLCEDSFTPATFYHGLCGFTGAFIAFWALFAAVLWTSLAINTFVTLHLRWKIDRSKWGIVTLSLCVMYPAVVMIAGTAKKEWKYSPPIPWCWWTTSGMEWGLFYSCLIVCSLASCVCIMFVLFELRNIQDSSKGKKAKYFKFLRVTCFLVLFLEVIICLISTQSIAQARGDEFAEATTAYGRCLLTNAENPCPRPADGEGTLGVATWFWLLVNVSGVGIPGVLVFGTTGPVLFFWCRACSSIMKGEGIGGLDSRGSMQDSSQASGKGFDPGDEDSYDPDAD